MKKLTLVVSLCAGDAVPVAEVYQTDDGYWKVTMDAPVQRADLTRMLMAAGALVPMLPATDDAATHARMAELERWQEDLRKEVETLGGRLKGTETACEVLRSERDDLRQEVKDLRRERDNEMSRRHDVENDLEGCRMERDDLKGALEMERAGAAALLRESGAQPGETLREVVLRLKRQRDEAKQGCDVATAQNERLRAATDNMLNDLQHRTKERDDARQETETLRRNLADAQTDNANNAAEVERLAAMDAAQDDRCHRAGVEAKRLEAEVIRLSGILKLERALRSDTEHTRDRMQTERDEARQEVERLTGELVKLSDALNEEHDKRREAEATIARFQSRCTLTLFTILSGMQRDNPLEGNVLNWEWDNGVGRVVLCRRK